MNNDEIKKMVYAFMDRQCSERGYAAPVDVLMDIGVLSKQKYEEWRFRMKNKCRRLFSSFKHRLQ